MIPGSIPTFWYKCFDNAQRKAQSSEKGVHLSKSAAQTHRLICQKTNISFENATHILVDVIHVECPILHVYYYMLKRVYQRRHHMYIKIILPLLLIPSLALAIDSFLDL